MRKISIISASLGCLLAASLCGGAASAKVYHHRHYHHGPVYVAQGRHPLLVERRSFLEPGPVVPVGTYTRYVYAPVYQWGDPPSTYQRSWYMDENLHQAFDPQPQAPLVWPPQFWP
jgi:hypothetical protein